MDSPQIYGLDLQARALTSQQHESENIRFLVGTQSLKLQNQIHLIDVSDDNSSLNSTILSHPAGEIWHLSASPFDPNLITTCYNKTDENVCTMKCNLWKINETGLDVMSCIPVEKLGLDVKQTWFHPTDAQSLLSIVDNKFVVWNVTESEVKDSSVGTLAGKSEPKFTVGKWNPHHGVTQVATCNDSHVRGWDIRSGKQAWMIESAHGQLVRDIDFNPNKQYYLASCGDDGFTKFWDLRNASEPLITRSDHSHWVWTVRFNNFHDQLVLTSSSDARVVLSCVSGISSEPDGALVASDDETSDTGKHNRLEDGVISRCETHEDSVYIVEWSTSDPWTFASLSYDGRLVISTVPKSFKFKILL